MTDGAEGRRLADLLRQHNNPMADHIECKEFAVPSPDWPPGQTERTAISHAFVDADGVRPGTRCQCGRAVVGNDGMPREDGES